MIQLNIAYNSQLFYFDPEDYDGMILKVAGKTCSGSGIGFGSRDMDFYFQTRTEAQIAKNKIMLLNIVGLTAAFLD